MAVLRGSKSLWTSLVADSQVGLCELYTDYSEQHDADVRPVDVHVDTSFAHIEIYASRCGLPRQVCAQDPIQIVSPFLDLLALTSVHRSVSWVSIRIPENANRTSPANTLSAAAQRLSMAYGPGRKECETATSDGQSYGRSVLARSFTNPPGDWDQKVRLYSEGLLREQWTPSFQVAESPAKGVEGSETAAQPFKCPVNIIFGMKDVALDPRVVLDGIEKYFKQDADDGVADATQTPRRVLKLPDCGHWSIIEDQGVMAMDRVLREIVGERE